MAARFTSVRWPTSTSEWWPASPRNLRPASVGIRSLPSYSPELNPDERLNASLKHAIGITVPVRTKAKLKAAAQSHMEMLANAPKTVMAFFHDPRCKYAA